MSADDLKYVGFWARFGGSAWHRLQCLACGYAGPEQAFGAAPRSRAPGDGVT